MTAARKDLPRGFARWERARLNSEKNPDHKVARRYRARIAQAESWLAAGHVNGVALPPGTGPTWARLGGAWYSSPEKTSRTYQCSTLCMLMELTLDCGERDGVIDQDSAAKLVAGRLPWLRFAPVDEKTKPRRAVRCSVCDAPLGPPRREPRVSEDGATGLQHAWREGLLSDYVDGKRVAAAGVLSMARADFATLIEACGGRFVTGSTSLICDIIVIGRGKDIDKSYNLTRARNHGAVVVSERELVESLLGVHRGRNRVQ